MDEIIFAEVREEERMRLIDRESVSNKLRNMPLYNFGNTPDHALKTLRKVLDVIYEQPTVEVIRYRDCKHFTSCKTTKYCGYDARKTSSSDYYLTSDMGEEEDD